MSKNEMTRPQSMGEEIANAITHGIGTLLSIAGAVVAICYAAKYGDAKSVVSACLYGSGLFFQHCITRLQTKRQKQFSECLTIVLFLF